jgi:hypothetical protein
MTTSVRIASEAEMLGPFLGEGREERWRQVFSRPAGRKKFLNRLYHENDIDPKCMVPITHLERSAENVYRKLKSLGAPGLCHIISARQAIDGKSLPLKTALDLAVDLEGTIICCIPGKLAYFRSEERNGHYLLMK